MPSRNSYLIGKKAFLTIALVALPFLVSAHLEPATGHASSYHRRARHNLKPRPNLERGFNDDHIQYRRSEPGTAIATSWDQVGDQVFDYVIAGGGTAGLALASRLSQDSDVTVAVIETGGAGYDQDEAFLTPSNAYFKSSVNSEYDWQYQTVPQNTLIDAEGKTGRQALRPRGKTLCSSSAINGLYYVAASKREHQVWGRMSGDLGNWGWHSVRSAMKKSQRFNKNTVKALDKYLKYTRAAVAMPRRPKP